MRQAAYFQVIFTEVGIVEDSDLYMSLPGLVSSRISYILAILLYFLKVS